GHTGLASVAAPVFGSDDVHAAIGILGTEAMLTEPPHGAERVQALRDAADELSASCRAEPGSELRVLRAHDAGEAGCQEAEPDPDEEHLPEGQRRERREGVVETARLRRVRGEGGR